MRALFLWIGLNPMPEWRRDSIDIFAKLHPEFAIDDIWEKRESKTAIAESNWRRMQYCGEAKNRFWMDSDIELLAPLPFDEHPAFAWEGRPHFSMVWSGSRPDLFRRYSVSRLYNRRINNFFKPSGLYRHWQTGLNGEKLPRNSLGYKPEDFI